MSDPSLESLTATQLTSRTNVRALPMHLQRYGAGPVPPMFRRHRASLHSFWGIYAFAADLTIGIDGQEQPLPSDRLVVIPPFLAFQHPWAERSWHAYIHLEVASLPAGVVRTIFDDVVEVDDPELFRRYRRVLADALSPEGDLLVHHQQALAVGELALAGAFATLAASDRSRLSDPHAGWRAIQPALRLVEEQMGRPLSLRELGRSLGVGEQQCARLFRRHLGQSPMQYVIEQRVLRGARLAPRIRPGPQRDRARLRLPRPRLLQPALPSAHGPATGRLPSPLQQLRSGAVSQGLPSSLPGAGPGAPRRQMALRPHAP